MSLTQALGTAAAGLNTAQTALSLVAANVANAQTPGYTRRTISAQTTAAGGGSVSVRIASVNRELDSYLQSQLRSESSGGAYADLKSQFYQRLQQAYGDPTSSSSLETVYNTFTNAVQALQANPADYSAQSTVLSSARAVAQQLNAMTTSVQSLRGDAEQGLADSVRSANDALRGLLQVNEQLGASQTQDAAKAALLDQRDRLLDQLAQLMDIRVSTNAYDQVNVFTSSGMQLVGGQAAQLSFDPQGMLTPVAQWDPDPTKRQVGTITLTTANNQKIDLLQNKTFRSGQIAAYLEMRDQVLVQAQGQLDQLAAGMSSALSDKTTAGNAVTAGVQSGFDVDVGGVLSGNSIQVNYTDSLTNTRHKVTVVRVDDPSVLPLPNSTTIDPNDKVIGIDWSGGLASVVSQLNSAFNGAIQFSNPSGTTLRVLGGGAANTANVDGVSTTVTQTSLSGGSSEFPFFYDGNNPYTGAISNTGSQAIGYAGRITVNAALLANPGKLVAYQASTPAGDQTRPNFIYNQLTNAAVGFSPTTGIGSTATPFVGSLPSFLRQAMSQQGEAANAAQSLAQGQDMVVNALKQRFNESSSVNIDQEMSNLLTLQTAYGANARVFSAINDMLATLLKM